MRHYGVVAALCLGVSAWGAGKPQLVDEIVAKVNGDIVTRSELERNRRELESAAKGTGGARGMADAAVIQERAKNILRERIDELLLVQRAKQLDLSVDSDVNKYLSDIQKQVGIADPDQFREAVRAQTGQTFEDYKNQIKNQYLTQRVLGQEVFYRLQVPRTEVEAYYNTNKAQFIREESLFLREILISDQKPNAEAKAKDIAARARKGEKFGELARDNSDSDTAKQQGELPSFKKGELDPVLEKAVWGKDRGFVTDPIKRPNGWLILRVEEQFKAGQATLEEVAQEIEEKIRRPRMEGAIRQYLTKLRQDAFLEIKDGYLDTGAAPGKDTKWQDVAQLQPETVTKDELSNQSRRKKLLWMVPIPGTKTTPKGAAAKETVGATSKAMKQP